MTGNKFRWSLWVPLVIVSVTVLAYVNAFGTPFLFDDEPIITTNPDTRVLFPIEIAARWLVNLTFKLNYAIGGFRVADYHAVNLLVHIGAALFLYGWLRRTLLLPRAGGGTPATHDAAAPAGAVAGLWAVHPLQTESVTYICQRYESLMGLCYLATMYAFVRGVQARGRNRAAAWFGMAVAACLLGMGTKEIMVTAPLLALLYDGLLVGPSACEILRRRGWVHAGLWATLLAFAGMEWQMFAVVAQQGEGVTLAISPVSYLMTQLQVIPHYLRLSLLPHPLCLDYAWPFVTSWRQVVLPGALLVGLGLLTLGAAVKRRPVAFAGLWFFIILAPTSSVVPVPDAAFEHRMYLPLAGVLTVGVLGGYGLLRRCIRSGHGLRRIGMTAWLVLMVCGAVMTHVRNRAYRSGLTLWQDVVAVRPDNHRARLNVTSALLSQARYKEAEAAGSEVVSRLGYCSELTAEEIPSWGQNAAQAAIYRDARHYAIAHNLLGVARIQQGDAAGAEAHFREAVRILPPFADAARNLAELLRTKEKPRREAGLSPSN